MGSQTSALARVAALYDRIVDELAKDDEDLSPLEENAKLKVLLNQTATALGGLLGGGDRAPSPRPAAPPEPAEPEPAAVPDGEDPDRVCVLDGEDGLSPEFAGSKFWRGAKAGGRPVDADDEDDDEEHDDLSPADADELIRRGAPWVDETFPPDAKSLGKPEGDPAVAQADRDWGAVRWAKASELVPGARLFINSPNPVDVAQGALGDCYLLSALCVLAERPARIHKLFETTELNRAGVVACKLFLHGELRSVLVDDYLPTIRGDFAFARSKTRKELWVSLYEKAFAKAFGSYARPSGHLAR